MAKLECDITGPAFESLSPFSRKAGILSPNFECLFASSKFGIAGGAYDEAVFVILKGGIIGPDRVERRRGGGV